MQVLKFFQLLFLFWVLGAIQDALGQPLALPSAPPQANVVVEQALSNAHVTPGRGSCS